MLLSYVNVTISFDTTNLFTAPLSMEMVMQDEVLITMLFVGVGVVFIVKLPQTKK